MKNIRPLSILILFGILASLLLTAAVPLPNQSIYFSGTGRSDLARLIDNNRPALSTCGLKGLRSTTW
jgi:hypothetical protein